MAIEDPVKRNIAGVALFGTQWEDVKAQVIDATASGIQNVRTLQARRIRLLKTLPIRIQCSRLRKPHGIFRPTCFQLYKGENSTYHPGSASDLTGTLIPFIENRTPGYAICRRICSAAEPVNWEQLRLQHSYRTRPILMFGRGSILNRNSRYCRKLAECWPQLLPRKLAITDSDNSLRLGSLLQLSLLGCCSCAA